MTHEHKSVLLERSVEELNVKKGEVYVDATLGGGGHTRRILELGGKVFAVDVDPLAIRNFAKTLSLDTNEEEILYAKGEGVTLAQGNFKMIRELANKFGVWEASGILFDLGWSSLQMESRGLSFMKENSLDMRLDPQLGVTAADLVNGFSVGELDELFTKYGEESNSRRIARAIVGSRVKERISTTTQLASIVAKVSPRRGKIHPATQVFQALRIVVNNELENLQQGLVQAEELLKEGGRMVVISFHSLEDRIVKNFLRNSGSLRVLTEKPLVSSAVEAAENRRSRSAKMRVAEKSISYQ